MEDVSGDNGKEIDPLEMVSDFEEDGNDEEELEDENKNNAIENDDMEVEEQE